jgi:hypothetical protein
MPDHGRMLTSIHIYPLKGGRGLDLAMSFGFDVTLLPLGGVRCYIDPYGSVAGGIH